MSTSPSEENAGTDGRGTRRDALRIAGICIRLVLAIIQLHNLVNGGC